MSSVGDPDWLPLQDALTRMARGKEATDEVWKHLLVRLKSSTVRTRAVVWEQRELEIEPEIRRDIEVPSQTWTEMREHNLADARSGFVEVHGSMPDDNKPLTIMIHGLAVFASDIADLLEREASVTQGRSGRPRGEWWPDLVEEMTVYFYEKGMPDETAPRAPTVSAILDRMSRRGCKTPSPKTVYPVLDAVLKRLRAL